ncbi:ABC transporter permease [Elioraea sp.]|uniref:ABC transporter permease n=1 Tax=Elioraea sp. TaxID=2185103 RepID=UPI0025C21F56|nr:ABC transporter permease [Elioraea sp.]
MILWLIVALVGLYLMAPVLVVIATSFTATAYPVFPPQGFTWRWFGEVLASPEYLAAMRFSTALAAASTAIATVLGTLAALGLVRGRFRGQTAISALFLSPIFFPAIVLGLALLIFFNWVGLAGTFPGMVAAHAVLTTPFVIRMVSASLAEFDPAVEEAAKNLGASAMRTFFLVTLPLIRPGVVAGAVFAFIISFDELVVSLFLAGPGMQTLPIRIFTSLEYSSRPSVSAVSTLLILVWLVVGVPLYRRFLDVRHT